MSQTFLQKMVAETRDKIASVKSDQALHRLRTSAERVRSTAKPHRFRDALSRSDHVNIIAEIKRASPSKGVINDRINVEAIAKEYALGGAAAISVLTESDYFNGSLEDLSKVRVAVELPILRKDFVVDEFQVYESAALGADAVLLIVAALTDDELDKFLRLVRDELRMNALVEVHDKEELTRAELVGADIIGVNNRDLHSLSVSLDTSRELIRFRPNDALMIAESGLSKRDEIDELRELGYDGFLIGESLMRAVDPVGELRRLIG